MALGWLAAYIMSCDIHTWLAMLTTWSCHSDNENNNNNQLCDKNINTIAKALQQKNRPCLYCFIDLGLMENGKQSQGGVGGLSPEAQVRKWILLIAKETDASPTK